MLVFYFKLMIKYIIKKQMKIPIVKLLEKRHKNLGYWYQAVQKPDQFNYVLITSSNLLFFR